MTLTTAEAAQLLGMKPSEVLSTEAVAEGCSVRLFDGTEVLVVPEDRPDAAGQFGVMLRESPGAMNRLPVYVPHPVDDEDVAAPADEGDDDAPEPEPEPAPAKRPTKKAAAKKPAPADEGDDDA